MIYKWLCVFIKRGSWMGGGTFFFSHLSEILFWNSDKHDSEIWPKKQNVYTRRTNHRLTGFEKKIAPVSCNTKNWGLLHLYIHFSIYFSSLSIPAKYPAMLLFILIFKNMLWKQLKIFWSQYTQKWTKIWFDILSNG